MNIVLAVGFEKMEKGNLSQKFADTHRSPTEKHFEQMQKQHNIFLHAALIGIGVFMASAVSLPSVTGQPSATKPYSDFKSFYPFYLSQHSDTTNQILHASGTAIVSACLLHSASLLCPIIIGVCAG